MSRSYDPSRKRGRMRCVPFLFCCGNFTSSKTLRGLLARGMSSCLCKKAEGTVPPFVFFILTIEDGIDDSIHARDVHEANHRASSSAHLDKASLDHVGGAQLAPERPGEVEEGEQLGQIRLQPLHHRRVDRLPASSKTAKRPLGLAPTLCPIDCLGVAFHRLVVAPANLL